MINAISSFYQAGQIRKAGQIYSELRKRFPHKDFDVPLITFVRKRITEKMSNIVIKDATELILMTLREAYFRYAVRDDDQAAGSEAWAMEIYRIYQKEFGDYEVLRVDLPGFELLRFLAFNDFMIDPFYPQYLRAGLLGRIKIERPDLFEKLQKQRDIFIEKVQEAQTNQ